jgi:hypothetical protein
MPATYEPIESKVLGTAVSTVTFSSIPQSYTDLVLVFSGNAASGSIDSVPMRFNGDTATNYSYQIFDGSGSSASAGRASNATFISTSLVIGSEVSNNIWHIFNYSNATTFKTIIGRANVAGSYIRIGGGMWRKTPEAITSVTVFHAGSVNFVVGSTFTLYGIKAA